MKKLKLIVNGQEVELKFGYGLLRLLSEKWKLNSLSEFFERISSIGGNGDVTFDQLNIFGDIIEAAAFNNGFVIDSDEAVEWLLTEPTNMAEIMKLFIVSMPKPAEKKSEEEVMNQPKK